MLDRVMMRTFPARVKISMMPVLMTVTLTDQMERVKGMNLCIVTITRDNEEKESGLSLRFIDMPRKSRKKRT